MRPEKVRAINAALLVLGCVLPYIVMYTTLVLMPQFLQNVQQRSATESGVMLAPLGGALSDRGWASPALACRRCCKRRRRSGGSARG